MTDKNIEFPHTFKLKYPFEVDGKQKTEIILLRFPRMIADLPIDVADIRQRHYIPVLAKMTDEPQFVFELMCQYDFRVLVTLVSAFF